MVDINEYCKYPIRFQHLPETTRTHFDYICDLKKNFNIDWKTQFSKLGLGIVNFPYNFVASIFTPEGLKMLSILTGINLTSKISLNLLLRGIAKGVGPEIMDEAIELAAERGALYVNNIILTTVLTSSVEEGSVAAIGLTITNAISTSLSEIETITIIIQTLGALIDAWDPEGYSNELNAETMEVINESFNSEFITRFLSTVTIAKDKYGNPIHLSGWPVEYHLDAMLAAKDSKKNQQSKFFEYIVEYLDSLEFNSDGHRIHHYNPNDTNKLITNTQFSKLATQLEMVINNKNTIVANWTKTHWFIVLAGVSIIVFLFLKK